MSSISSLITVKNLRVAYGPRVAVSDVSFEIGRGEAFGLAGESGCGKSTVALALLGYRHPSSRILGGEIVFKSRNLLSLSRKELNEVRGRYIGFVPQNPTTALNPSKRVGSQVTEVLLAHGASDARNAQDCVVRLFGKVNLPDPLRIGARYPHQLSGGQQQRVCIAMALACDPELVVLDEPTTGLDVTTQQQIVELLITLQASIGMSMLYVTHDLGVMAQIANRVGIMYAGHMIEIGQTAALFDHPFHPYTRGLIASIPHIEGPLRGEGRSLRGTFCPDEIADGCPFQPRCVYSEPSCADRTQVLTRIASEHDVACQRWDKISQPDMAALNQSRSPTKRADASVILSLKNLHLAYKGNSVVNDVNLSIRQGETLGLVGESGSGKSTVARAISGLLAPRMGNIQLDGKPLPPLVSHRTPEQRRRIQYIFQNPDASLNPRSRIYDILARPLEVLSKKSKTDIRGRVEAAISDVSLPTHYLDRYPDQLSGGERQRIAIARGLIVDPEILICDEVLSALDVSVQASITDLLRKLCKERGVTMLFIAHDLAVVRQLADDVAVMFRGQLIEIGPTQEVFQPPLHPYTRSLLMAVPDLKPKKPKSPRGLKVPCKTLEASACVYAGRCEWQPGPVCETDPPPLRKAGHALSIWCHLSIAALSREVADR